MKKKPDNKKSQNPPRAVREYTAGGVVFRRRRRGIDILMIQDRMGRWTIPKGHVEEGEKLEETALREVTEETGLTELVIHDRLDKIHFFYRKEGKLIFMTTYVFLMEATGRTNDLKPEASEGIAAVAWFDRNAALRLIEYRDTEKLFRLGLSRIARTPQLTNGRTSGATVTLTGSNDGSTADWPEKFDLRNRA